MNNVAAGLVSAGVAIGAGAEAIHFERDVVGARPAGWQCGATGRGTPRWSVEHEAAAPGAPQVLKQSGAADFPWCARLGHSFTDGFVEVRFKPVAGREDQAGGVVWRWKDGDNYYVARANALENNVALYYTDKGRRITIKYADAPVAKNAWHTLRAEFKGTHVRVLLDGKVHIEVDDSHIAGAGLAGVWTKADSVTLFDGFSAGS